MIVVCDIDGVIADPAEFVEKYLPRNGKRNWKEYFEHTMDIPIILPMQELINLLIFEDVAVHFITGRPESNRELTERWLVNNLPSLTAENLKLFMRADGDRRPSCYVKLDFCYSIHPTIVFDDEPETCEVLSDCGLTVLKVCGHRDNDRTDRIPS